MLSKIKNKVKLLGAAVIMAGMVMLPGAAAAEDGVDLGNLVVLDQLFSGTGVVSASQGTITVQPGDTLSGISLEQYGDASMYPVIAEANSLADPNLILPGQELVIPAQTDMIDQETTTMDGLFGDSANLGDLFILDELFNNGGGDILNGGDNDLGDLFILDQLFSNNGGMFGGTNGLFGGGTNGGSLGNLIILDELFGSNGDSILNGGGGILNGGDNDLGDLFILDQLFSNNGGGMFGGTNGGNLGDLIILEELFN